MQSVVCDLCDKYIKMLYRFVKKAQRSRDYFQNKPIFEDNKPIADESAIEPSFEAIDNVEIVETVSEEQVELVEPKEEGITVIEVDLQKAMPEGFIDINSFCQKCGVSMENHYSCNKEYSFMSVFRYTNKCLVCKECDQVFVMLSGARSHVKRGKNKYFCQKCPSGFVFVSELKNHLHTEHRDEAVECTNCGHICMSSYLKAKHQEESPNCTEFV
jgi:hypothetical protein